MQATHLREVLHVSGCHHIGDSPLDRPNQLIEENEFLKLGACASQFMVINAILEGHSFTLGGSLVVLAHFRPLSGVLSLLVTS